MGRLDGFQLYTEKKREIFLTIRKSSVTFSKAAIEALGYPAFVHMFLNPAEKAVAIQASAEDGDAIRFFCEPKPGKQLLVRWADTKKVAKIAEAGSLSIPESSLRVFGEFLEEEKAILFDLKSAEKAEPKA